MIFSRIALTIASLAAAGCTNNSYCTRSQAYDNARSIPVIQATAGLQIPESPTAMRVPEQTAQDLPYGFKVEDPKKPGKTRYRCLDQPPTLSSPVPAEGKAAS